MDFEQAERRFQELQKQRDDGLLDEAAFRVEVAKLLLRDQQGVFWMLDADHGTWFCNRGDGWTAGDPHTGPRPEAVLAEGRRQRTAWLVITGVALAAVLSVVGTALWPGGRPSPAPPAPTPTAGTGVRVTIASPTEGSQVALGQMVAIESTLEGAPDLQAVARVECSVNGEVVAAQPVRAQLQPGQASFPLSLPWRPAHVGRYRVEVTALSDTGMPLGAAAITVTAVEAPAGARSGLACVPDAVFVADVTIAPGTAFPPGARMDKVWQVHNSGTCAWGRGYELSLVEGDPLGAPEVVPVPPTAAGERADLAITFWAPDLPGSYANAWQLQAPDGQFFGPLLPLTIQVEVQAAQSLPPAAPGHLRATPTDDGRAVLLTWEDRSDNEEAFRIYRADIEASIGLAPANAGQFVDQRVTCGRTYHYTILAFNAAGTSPSSEVAQVTLPACVPADTPPTLLLTVVPTQVVAGAAFTITFQAGDDLGVIQVIVWGEETGEPALDMGQIFTCTGLLCTGAWPITDTAELSATLGLYAVARDSSGQNSALARATVVVRRAEE